MNLGSGAQTYPHQIVLLLLRKLHNTQTGLCCCLCETEGYFLLPVYHLALMGADGALEDASGGFQHPPSSYRPFGSFCFAVSEA